MTPVEPDRRAEQRGRGAPDGPRGYAICTTIRSGSTWLAEVLAGTGVLGRPAEYFSTRFQKRMVSPDYPEAVRDQAAYALRHGSTPNGVYGFKIYPMQLDAVSASLDWTAFFPRLRFVHLARRDLLGQAISRARVNQTLQWRSTLPASAEPRYDGAAILAAMRETVAQDARWQLFFARTGVAPLRLVYEDALPAADATVEAVARLVGLDGPAPAAPGRVAVAVQRDGISAEWRERFIAEFGDRDAIDAGLGT